MRATVRVTTRIRDARVNTPRQFIIALASGALAATYACFAQQQPKVARVAVLEPAFDSPNWREALSAGLRERGYVEGKNIIIDYGETSQAYPRHQPEDREGNRIDDSAGVADARRQGNRVTTRREFLTVGSLAVLMAEAPALAQQGTRPWRIGFLISGKRPASMDGSLAGTILQGLRELGYVEGKHFAVEWRFAEERQERLHELASDLKRSKVDIIVAMSSFSVAAARKAAPDIPIVMTGVGNPVASGFVSSLSRPGGNITGLTNVSTVISGKYLDLLHSAVPRLSNVAILIDPSHPNHPTVLSQVQAAGKKLGVQVMVFELKDPDRVADVLQTVLRGRPGALIVPANALWSSHTVLRIADIALKNKLPTMFGNAVAVGVGGLLGYEPNRTEIGRRAAALVDKILKGAKPGDIPVELPTRYDLTVNLKTAKALGLAIPESVLVQATRVIE